MSDPHEQERVFSNTDEFAVGSRKAAVTCLTVQLGPPPDDAYTQVVLRVPGICRVRLSSVDAQRLGHALLRAGGGSE